MVKRYSLSGTALQDIVIWMLLLVIVGAVGHATTHAEANEEPLVSDPVVVVGEVPVLAVVRVGA
jgi:hypothetical protein